MLNVLSGAHPTLPLDLLAGLTLLGLAPFFLVMTTSFARIVVVLSLVRTAMGTQTLPPNTVITGFALVLTFLIMSPTLQTINHTAIQPYDHGQISQAELVDRAVAPMRSFMLRQTSAKDLAFFDHLAHRNDDDLRTAPVDVLIPAFVVGELRSAFALGFGLYLPFIAIDLAVAAILLGLGMFMLSPNVVSLPCKLFLFIAVDGWALIAGGLISSYR